MELNEEVLEHILTRQRKEYESLLEEKFSRLDTKVGALDTKVSALDTKVGALDAKVNTMDVKIDQTEKRLEEAIVRQGEEYQRYMGVWAEDLKSRIQLTAEGVSALFTEVSKINTEDEKNKRTILKLEIDQIVLDGRIRKKVDREDLAELEARVSKLETSR